MILAELLTQSWWLLPAVALVGLLAGVLGGMLGVGGSVIMIPGMAILLTPTGQSPAQHVFQAAAMIANVAVSIPAARRHYQAGAMVRKVMLWMMPTGIACVLMGVWLSNRAVFRGEAGKLWLARIFALFLLYVIFMNLRRLYGPRMTPLAEGGGKLDAWRGLTAGGVMGGFAGLLGVGGGGIAVPLQQILLRLPLRHCIANSAGLIIPIAAIGAIYKNSTLAAHDATAADSLLLAAVLVPTAWLGGRAGAGLTHKLPVRQVRIAFIIMMLVAAVKMAGIPGMPI